jgi:hypothetical protein
VEFTACPEQTNRRISDGPDVRTPLLLLLLLLPLLLLLLMCVCVCLPHTVRCLRIWLGSWWVLPPLLEPPGACCGAPTCGIQRRSFHHPCGKQVGVWCGLRV